MVTKEHTWTHRAYFRQFRLNVEQYGEILVAHAFHGEKKGDAQPCYDVEAAASDVRAALLAAGISPVCIDDCLADHADAIRIEVKCKLARTAMGRAKVFHCRNKLKRVRNHDAATHFAVLLFDGEGDGIAKEAWFFTTKIAEQLQRKDTKSGYIPVSSVRKSADMALAGLIDIRSLINGAADSALTLSKEASAVAQ